MTEIKKFGITMKKLYYLAHPYTGNIEANLKKCNDICNNLLDLGYVIISPITHSHQLDILKTRPAEFWYDQDFVILKHCDGIIMSSGWQDSKGCLMEYQFAMKHGIEVRIYKSIIEEILKRIP